MKKNKLRKNDLKAGMLVDFWTEDGEVERGVVSTRCGETVYINVAKDGRVYALEVPFRKLIERV